MIKGAVFDVDGLLVDTEGYQYRGWVEVLKPLGLTITPEEYFQYAGKTGSLIEQELVKKYGLKIKERALIEVKEKLLIKWFGKESLKPMPHAKEAVQFFIDKGLKIAVCSGSPEEEIKLKLRKTGLDKFSLIITSGNDVKRGKPFPDSYIMAAKKLGLKPEECMAFEDTQYGLQSAKDAGLKCLAVPSQYSTKQDFSRADGIFPSLREAVDFVKNHLI